MGAIVQARHLIATLLGVAFLSIFLIPTSFAQQPPLRRIVLRDGTDLRGFVVRVEGQVTVIGSPSLVDPIRVPTGEITCNVPVGDQCTRVSGPTEWRNQPERTCAGEQRFGIHGSNTIGAGLMPLLVRRFAELGLAVGGKPGSFAINPPSTVAQEQTMELRDGAGNLCAVVDFRSHGSALAFNGNRNGRQNGLESGAAAIGMASRFIKVPEASNLARARGMPSLDMKSRDNDHYVALDGVAVIVNQANPLTALSLDEMCQIFTGQRQDWRDFGGAGGRISVYARDDASGTFEMFKELVLEKCDRAGRLSQDTKPRYESSDKLSDDVSKDPAAIGFIGLPYVGKNRALAVRQSCGLGIKATKYNIQAGLYPLRRFLHLYTVGQPEPALAGRLLSFALSDDAQRTIEDAEFINQAIDLQDPAEQAQWLEDARQMASREMLTEGQMDMASLRDIGRTRRRSTLHLRFDFASAVLDHKALDDVDRLARYLRGNAKRFVLMGFADAIGTYERNHDLSVERARSVAVALRRQGVAVADSQIFGMSKLAPVDCNDGDPGRAQNRRVEVWLEP